jgi:hypothetical protein
LFAVGRIEARGFKMKQYDAAILTELLDKYERSVLAKDGSNRNVKIFIKASHPIFKDYWSEDSYLYRDQIDMSIDSLVKKGFVAVSLDQNKEMDSITLIVDTIDDAYRFIKRRNPKIEVKMVIEYLTGLITNVDFLRAFVEEIINRLKHFQTTTTYFDSLLNLKLYIHVIEEMAKLEEDVLKRNFSKKVLNDSKAFERIENKICHIIRDFSETDDEDDEKMLEEYHIVKTPTFVYIKGDITIKIKNQVINLHDYGHELALSSDAMNDVSIIGLGVKKVLTIENLTTFVAFNNADFICIYLGGFHNSVKRNLLLNISNYKSNLEFYHFGDIDAGGFLIFEDLVKKTQIPFLPYLMDVDTLIKCNSNWSPLTRNDKIRLGRIKDGPFLPVAIYMLKNNCKLEQEAVV